MWNRRSESECAHPDEPVTRHPSCLARRQHTRAKGLRKEDINMKLCPRLTIKWEVLLENSYGSENRGNNNGQIKCTLWHNLAVKQINSKKLKHIEKWQFSSASEEARASMISFPPVQHNTCWSIRAGNHKRANCNHSVNMIHADYFTHKTSGRKNNTKFLCWEN